MCNENLHSNMAAPGVKHVEVQWDLFKQLQQRFPEVPDYVVRELLKQNDNNESKCAQLLQQESDRYLYANINSSIPKVEHDLATMQITDAERRHSFSHNSTNTGSPKMSHVSSVPHIDGANFQNAFRHSNSTPTLNVECPNVTQASASGGARSYHGAHTAPVIPQGSQPYNIGTYDNRGQYVGPPQQGGYSVPTQVQNWMKNQGYNTPPRARPHSAEPPINNVAATSPLYINVDPASFSAGENFRQVYLSFPTGGLSPAAQGGGLQHQYLNSSQHSTGSRLSDPAVYYPTQRQLSQASAGSRHSNHSGGRQTPPVVSSAMQYVGAPPVTRPSVLDLSMAPFYANFGEGSITPGEDPAYIQALIEHQRARMHQLESDINVLGSKIAQIHTDILHKEHQLQQRRARELTEHQNSNVSTEEIKKLRETNRSLLIDIQCMTREIDLYNFGQLRLGVTDLKEQQSFFTQMTNTGQTGRVPPPPIPPHNDRPPAVPPRAPITRHREAPPPPVSPPPQSPPAAAVVEDDGRQWNCSYCTFLNHPALTKCEVCEMPRIPALTSPPQPTTSTASVSHGFDQASSHRHESRIPPPPYFATSTGHGHQGAGSVTTTYRHQLVGPPPSYPSSGRQAVTPNLELPPGYQFSGSVARSVSHPPPNTANSLAANSGQNAGRMTVTRTESGDWELVDP